MIDHARANAVTQDIHWGSDAIPEQNSRLSTKRPDDKHPSTYKAQSMAKMMVISFAGIFTADMTKSMVTRPADGIEAAPTEATVAVKLIPEDPRIASDFPPRRHSPDDDQLPDAKFHAHQLSQKNRSDRFVQRRSV